MLELNALFPLSFFHCFRSVYFHISLVSCLMENIYSQDIQDLSGTSVCLDMSCLLDCVSDLTCLSLHLDLTWAGTVTMPVVLQCSFQAMNIEIPQKLFRNVHYFAF